MKAGKKYYIYPSDEYHSLEPGVEPEGAGRVCLALGGGPVAGVRHSYGLPLLLSLPQR